MSNIQYLIRTELSTHKDNKKQLFSSFPIQNQDVNWSKRSSHVKIKGQTSRIEKPEGIFMIVSEGSVNASNPITYSSFQSKQPSNEGIT